MAKKKTVKKKAARGKSTTKGKKATRKKKAKVPRGRGRPREKGTSVYLQHGMTSAEWQESRSKLPMRWNEHRIAVVKALRALRAFSASAARKAGEISAKAKVEGLTPKKVKIHCDQYRGSELVAHGYVKTYRHEGERELSYYLTITGRKVKLV